MGIGASSSLSFNVDAGYLEGLVRGFKAGILRQTDYLNLIQCETLDGIFAMILYFHLKLIELEV